MVFLCLSPQFHWLFLKGHQSLSSLIATNHSCCLPCALKKEWPVISMVKFNPIHLNMHRQEPVGTRAPFITAQLLLLLPCIVAYVCVHGISPDLSWRRQGKMMGEQRDRQSNRAFKTTSDCVRLWFFSPPFFSLLQGKRSEQLLLGCLEQLPPLLPVPLSSSFGDCKATVGILLVCMLNRSSVRLSKYKFQFIFNQTNHDPIRKVVCKVIHTTWAFLYISEQLSMRCSKIGKMYV